ncbi:hypothetical protein BG015_011240 [Linnemannia schmuckeri]|uniref:Opi1-domain-containing protein n=1 Tax=Linnemannia schmuckeri TaxID=64567 RepID=A0A9P5RTD1_9FUNG|nr:hypothetical protein BG015_011240 [Linnemannia schmuckeri]
MPPAPSAKAQPMSISQLCQQNDSDNDFNRNNHTVVKQELDQDPLDLNNAESHYQQQHQYRNGNNNNHYNNNQHRYSNSSDEFEEFDTTPRSRQQQQPVPDPAEQLAAEALGDMANATPRSSSSSSTTTTTTTSSSSSFVAPTTPFISRMSSLPLVNSALKAYESGKQNSKVMKYGAEMVESSVKSLSKPVFDQLEKVYPAKSDAQALPSPTNSARSSNDILRPDNNGPTTNGAYYAYRSRGDSIDSTSSNTSSRPSFDVLRSRSTRHEEATLRQRSDSQSSQRSFQYPGSANGYYPQQQQQTSQPPQQQQQQQVSTHSSAPSQQFSGWRGVVATVGTASAAGVAIFSEESMKSLKYCLQWLQYAVQHIDHQIGLLRAFLVSLASPSSSTAMVPSTAASTLASIKKEVVETLRKVINVVSRYAGACLPDQAKISVRQFILSMPVRWATLNNESVPSTPMGSPSLGPQSDRNPEQQAALNETSERATKVLVLAHESSDMLKSVASIFKDSVDKAENWMDKLRYVGMNPQNNSEGLPSWAPTGFPGAPPGGMPGGFPGTPVPGSSNGLEQYSLRNSSTTSSVSNSNGHNSNGISNGNGTGSPSRSLKSSPRMSGRTDNHRHAYRQQKNNMSGDEESGTEEEDIVLGGMDDSEDERLHHHSTGVHAPLKRSMGSANSTHQGNAVRRRKKRGESAEVVAGLGLQNSDAVPRPIKEEVM